VTVVPPVWCISTETKDNVWVVNGAHGSAVVDGPVLNNATIRLLHLATNLNLHSHSARSPATQQQVRKASPVAAHQSLNVMQEVTGCSGDANDNWSVKCGTNGKWEFGQVIQLLHVNTNHRLHSHPSKFASSSTEQLQEVTGYALGDYNDDCENAC
jgi:dolichyl-phosphate-mannose--protein O-mannosyl transferase